MGYITRFVTLERELLVIAWHSISGPPEKTGSCDDMSYIRTPVEIFCAQIKWLEKTYKFITIDDILEGKMLPEKAALVTFDDGFKDIYTTAIPFLEARNIRGTIFLTGQHLAENKASWITRLHYILDRAPSEFYCPPLERTLSVYTSAGKKYALSLMKDALCALAPDRQEEFLETIRFALKIKIPDDITKKLYLAVNDIKKLSSLGWTIGGHSYSHTFLPVLSKNELIDDCRRTCAAMDYFPSYRPVYAIPFGLRNSYNDEILGALSAAGMQNIFAISSLSSGHSGIIINRIMGETHSLNHFKLRANKLVGKLI